MAYNELFDNIQFGYDGNLSFGHKQIDNNGIKKLVDVLNTRNIKCRSLALYKNQIGNDGIIELSKYLKVNNTIKDLYISSNRFDVECMDEFADMIKHNRSIESLYMSWNMIGDVGFIKLFDALKYNTTLKSLSLHGCNITNNGAKEIIKILQHNYTLRSICINRNYIDHSYVTEIYNMLYMPYKLNEKGWYIYDHHIWDKQMKDIIYNMIMINNTDVNKLVYLPNELMYLIFYFIFEQPKI